MTKSDSFDSQNLQKVRRLNHERFLSIRPFKKTFPELTAESLQFGFGLGATYENSSL